MDTIIKPAEMAKYIDHTLLKADALPADIKKLCAEAVQYGFASVCVNPCYIGLASGLLKGTDVQPCTVVGFPLGASTPEAKACETRDAVQNGATEIDMVLAIGAAKSGDWDLAARDIQGVVDAAKTGNAIVKVIFETCLLTDEEIVNACKAAEKAGAHFVKTSTGLSTAGAKVEHVHLMRETVGNRLGVKAAGGIRDYQTALAMIQAGANRIGTSAGIRIVTESI